MLAIRWLSSIWFVVLLSRLLVSLGPRLPVCSHALFDWTRRYTSGLLLGMALRDTDLKKMKLSASVAFLVMSVCVITMLFIFYVQGTRYNMTYGYDMPLDELKSNWSSNDYAAYNSFGRMAYVDLPV